MIVFKRIVYKNLLSVGETAIDLRLDEHPTTLITAPNGSGKSILAEAITFALFDKSYRGLNKSDLINSINQKKCLVEIYFSSHGKEYKVTRGIKPNIFTIEQDGEILEQQASTRDQQQYLEVNILGFNYRSFCQTSILGTANYDPFMQLSAAMRREVSETMLDIGIFSTMNQLLKQRVSLWKQDCERVERDVDKKKYQISVQKEMISKLEESSDDQVRVLQKEMDALKQRASEANSKRDEIKSKIAEFDDDIDSIIDSLTEQHQKNVQKVTELSTIKSSSLKTIKFLESNDECPTCEQDIRDKTSAIEERHQEINDIERKLSIYDVERERISKKLSEMKDLSRQRDSLKAEESQLTASIKSTVSYAKGVKQKIDNAQQSNSKDSSGHRDKLMELCGELKALEDEQSRLIDMKPVYEASIKLLKDDGIKASIIDQFIPVLNAKVNEYLDILGFNIQFELDKNFKESIKSRFRDEFTYKNFSMGERQRLDLALLFAWRHVAQIKNSVNCNLLLLDEVFDSSIDEQGTNDLIAILRKACVDNNVFVVSHRGTMEERLKNTIKFKKVNGFTRLDG